ncbi:hypothetical protein [Sandaracinus amylolyticus]|uniref:DUF2336 domain-containing protein n=1 Tax=Sandaracinus amylolyticus TaxID=927083 RepID=A0A0F6W2F8_9BACT|nr:hypothetical protein [Sandaracinus amylolyticus]AKF05787.1 hypothetical protein DB32_002936 [Sandaracinus amylolyticus]
MDVVKPLPLTRDELPESLRRFGDPQAPTPARTMAARGVVPLKGGDLVMLLLQLASDPAPEIAESARGTLEKLPPEVLDAACDAPMPASFLDALADRVVESADRLERIVANDATADATVARIARTCPERVCERIAINEQRVLGAPAIIEALYKNRSTRMSTVDRLVELAARHGVELEGVHTYQAHVEAIQGQLLPEPSDEPLPGDQLFGEALSEDRDAEAIDQDAVEGTEAVKDEFRPLSLRIAQMTLQEKLRLTLVGNAAARALLVRDSNRIVAMAAIASPMTTEAEASGIANSRQVPEEVLRFIGNKREWLGNYEVKKALVFNPKTPVGIAMKFLSHLQIGDLRTLARSRGVSAAVKTAAAQRVAKKGS